jgi:hypothetical protein
LTPDTGQQEQRKEFYDRCFEFHKHIATLSTAAAVLILAIYGEQPFRVSLLAFALGGLALCVVLSVYGMLSIAVGGSAIRSPFIKAPNPMALLPEIWWLTELTAVLFMASVIGLALQLFDIPVWQGIAVIVPLLAIIFLLDFLVGRWSSKRRSRTTRRQED